MNMMRFLTIFSILMNTIVLFTLFTMVSFDILFTGSLLAFITFYISLFYRIRFLAGILVLLSFLFSFAFGFLGFVTFVIATNHLDIKIIGIFLMLYGLLNPFLLMYLATKRCKHVLFK